MRTKLDEREITCAIKVYMALKGMKIGDEFTFKLRKDKLEGIEFDIERFTEFDVQSIKNFANDN